jgi:hypothetical protein
MDCPQCHHECPPDAIRCICGWDFATPTQTKADPLFARYGLLFHPLVRRGRNIAFAGILGMFGFGALRSYLAPHPASVPAGLLADLSVVVALAGLAIAVVGMLRARRQRT